MEQDKKARAVLRSGFTKLHDKVVTLLRTQDKDISDVQANSSLLERKMNNLVELDKVIFEHMLSGDKSEDELEQESTNADEYQLKYEKLQIEVQKFLKTVDTDVCDNASLVHSVQGSTPRRKFKLPKIELKKFGGDIKEWLHFWSQFQKIHEDSEIVAEDKFQYLVQATVEGSRARELVNSFPPTAENYNKAVEGLKARFGREDMLVEVYVRELLTLVLRKVLNKNEQMSLCTLYDKLESQLRALDSLGVTSDKYASMLFPLVESSIPEELLRVWQRTSVTTEGPEVGSTESLNTKNRLDKLMAFVRSEVENEERIVLATSGFSLTGKSITPQKRVQTNKECDLPTAASLISAKSGNNSDCIFCGKHHNSSECFKAKKMSLEEKNKVINDKKCCYYCLKTNHFARKCRSVVSCLICSKRHMTFLCPELPAHNKATEESKILDNSMAKKENVLANHLATPEVVLQTLIVKLKGNNVERLVRAIIDTGSQRSYIMKQTAREMDYKNLGTLRLKHSLFGGIESLQQDHKLYRICVSSIDREYECKFDALEQSVIVGEISHIVKGKWMDELHKVNIKISDIGDVKGPIEILIGADIAGKLFTGRQIKLQSGLVALETCLGWTLMGKIPHVKQNAVNAAHTVTSMFIREASISDLWALDVLGITEPSEKKTKLELQAAVQQHFIDTVSVNSEGRFEVHLPWLEGHSPLPSNYNMVLRRLNSTIKKLNTDGYYEEYQTVFDEWSRDGIIEEVPEFELDSYGHYLPHRHVIKENSTTKIRPVFDASAREGHGPSLNDCLEKGINLIELIPSALLRFRLQKIGVIADIKRAFLQISLHKNDHNYLIFLWKTRDGICKVYRHCRVVFGVTSSPFLLGAVIRHHLQMVFDSSKLEGAVYASTLVEKLLNSFYVDNCITSLDNEDELSSFVQQAVAIMNERKFELRGWESTIIDEPLPDNFMSKVLGLNWNRLADTLEISSDCLVGTDLAKITKRIILSVAHKVFDPIGYSCPVSLCAKLLLRTAWESKINWDQEVAKDIQDAFRRWVGELHHLIEIKIHRWLPGTDDLNNWSLHTFCDASQCAYAAVIYLRVESSSGIRVQLIQAKSRVSPLKKVTIPRLELLAATIGARLHSSIVEHFANYNVKSVFWSDSSTVLAWLERVENWGVFVRNRVEEIKKLTGCYQWRHVPGSMNPADLPSRGCTARKLLESKWWEGPQWLRNSEIWWPTAVLPYDEVQINQEKQKAVVSSMLCGQQDGEQSSWYYNYFSSFKRIIRLVGWVARFVYNCQHPNEHMKGDLTYSEVISAESKVVKFIQQESFSDLEDKKLSTLHPYKDDSGVLRLKTKISRREDSWDFCHPIVLPGNHPVVSRLILEKHKESCHVGTQGLLCILREQYWITGGRKTIRAVIHKCVICRKQDAQKIESSPAPLPIHRIRDAAAFEIVGIDLAGPLFLRGDQKVWICLFTCAVYRAVHFELITSLSTEIFLQGFRRFIARRGRPKIVYSDNGTNFVGAENAFKKLNWEKISSYSTAQRIDWKFNPPTAAWWGGWWERLVQILKRLLRKVLGRALLNFEEMTTILCDCEAVVNSRPLTYVSEDSTDLTPLTPAMFIQDVNEVGTPDCDLIEANVLNRRMKYRQKLRKDLRSRFRTEYLGQLMLPSKVKNYRCVSVGDMVFVGNDNSKRLDWPLARVVQLLPGQDGAVRLVRVRTASGELLRPIQRIYPLEVGLPMEPNTNESDGKVLHKSEQKTESIIETEDHSVATITKRGRKVKVPLRYLLNL